MEQLDYMKILKLNAMNKFIEFLSIVQLFLLCSFCVKLCLIYIYRLGNPCNRVIHANKKKRVTGSILIQVNVWIYLQRLQVPGCLLLGIHNHISQNCYYFYLGVFNSNWKNSSGNNTKFIHYYRHWYCCCF